MAVFSLIDRRNQQRWQCSTWAAEAPRRACWAIPAFRRRRAASQRRSWMMTNWIGWVTANRYICFCFETNGRTNGLTQGLFSGRNNRENDLKCSCCQMYHRCVEPPLYQRGKSLFQLNVILSFTNTPQCSLFLLSAKVQTQRPSSPPAQVQHRLRTKWRGRIQPPDPSAGLQCMSSQPPTIHLVCFLWYSFNFFLCQDVFADEDKAQTGKDVTYDYEQDELGICKPVFLAPSLSLPHSGVV